MPNAIARHCLVYRLVVSMCCWSFPALLRLTVTQTYHKHWPGQPLAHPEHVIIQETYLAENPLDAHISHKPLQHIPLLYLILFYFFVNMILVFYSSPTKDIDHGVTEKDDQYHYIQAYQRGQDGNDCCTFYKECKVSVINMFTKLQNSILVEDSP